MDRDIIIALEIQTIFHGGGKVGDSGCIGFDFAGIVCNIRCIGAHLLDGAFCRIGKTDFDALLIRRHTGGEIAVFAGDVEAAGIFSYNHTGSAVILVGAHGKVLGRRGGNIRCHRFQLGHVDCIRIGPAGGYIGDLAEEFRGAASPITTDGKGAGGGLRSRHFAVVCPVGIIGIWHIFSSVGYGVGAQGNAAAVFHCGVISQCQLS